MRWNFKNIGEGLGSIADAKNRKDAAEAYRRATEVTAPEDEATLQSYRDAAARYQTEGQTAPPSGADAYDNSDYQPGGLGAQLNATNADTAAQYKPAADAYARAAASGAKYRMGGAEYDTAPTDQQKRMAGLASTRDVYAAKGLTEDSIKYGEAADRARAQAEQSQLHGLQTEVYGQALTKGKRDIKETEARDQIMGQHRAALGAIDELQKEFESAASPQEKLAIGQKLIQHYNQNIPNGQHAGLDPQTGTVHLINPDGTAKAIPFTLETAGMFFDGAREQANRHFENAVGSVSPADYEKMAAIKDRRTAQAEATAARKEDSKMRHLDRQDMVKERGLMRAAIEANKPAKVSASEAVKERVEMYATALVNSGDEPDRNKAVKKAWGLVFRDPSETKPDNYNPDDPMVEVQRNTPSGETYKVKLPLSKADPAAHRSMILQNAAGAKGGAGLVDAVKSVSAPPAAPAPVAAPSAVAKGSGLGATRQQTDFSGPYTMNELKEYAVTNPYAAKELEFRKKAASRRRGGGFTPGE